MLYVPLFFYIFEQLAERGKKDKAMPVEGGGEPALATAPHAKREDH